MAFRFTGNEANIDVRNPPLGHVQEFEDWAWVPLASLPDRVMPHKRENYRKMIEAFKEFSKK